MLLILALLGGSLATAQGASPGPALERFLPASVAGYTLVHFDHHDALHPRRRCPRGANPFSGCVADAQTVGSHPRADKPSIMIRALALSSDLTEDGLRRHLTRTIGPLTVEREGGRRVFTRRTLGTSYAAALLEPRTVVMAVAERHDRAASGARLARRAVTLTLARDASDPGPRARVRPPARRVRQGAAERPRAAFDRCYPADGSGVPVCPANPSIYAVGDVIDRFEGLLTYVDCRGLGFRIIFMCGYNNDLCPGDGRGVYERIFEVRSVRYSGWLSCSDVERIPYWATSSLNASCSWVFRLKQTTARSLTDTIDAANLIRASPTEGVSEGAKEAYSHGYWFEFTAFDTFPAVQWDLRRDDDDDSYFFHNYGGIPPGPRFARMFAACANP
jgi:hypothetical protein